MATMATIQTIRQFHSSTSKLDLAWGIHDTILNCVCLFLNTDCANLLIYYGQHSITKYLPTFSAISGIHINIEGPEWPSGLRYFLL